MKLKRKSPLIILASMFLVFASLTSWVAAADNADFRPTSVKETHDPKKFGAGYLINQWGLGFKPPKKLDGVTGYILVFSERGKADVVKTLDAYNIDSIYKKAETDKKTWALSADKKVYLFTNLDYADGLANHFRTGQLDVVTGKKFETGKTYNLYVGAVDKKSLLGLADPVKQDTKPIPDAAPSKDHEVSKLAGITSKGTPNELNSIEVGFLPAKKIVDIKSYFIFYTEESDLAKATAIASKMTTADIEKSDESKTPNVKIVVPGNADGKGNPFYVGQRTIEGKPLEKGKKYTVYVGTLGAKKVLAVVKARNGKNTIDNTKGNIDPNKPAPPKA